MITGRTETLAIDVDFKGMAEIELGQRKYHRLNRGRGFLSFPHGPLRGMLSKHVSKEIIDIHFKRESTLWESRKSRKSMADRGLSIHAPRFIIHASLCLIGQDLARLRDFFEAFRVTAFIRVVRARQFKIGLFDFRTGVALVYPQYII